MTTPRVTVYVPSRNYGRFLGEALQSVAVQSMDNWEAIVFTEGSTDDTLAVARRFAASHCDRVRIVETAEPQGLRACANQALELARGEFIMRLDADDYLDENALLVLCGYLDRNPRVGLVYPNWIYVTEAGDVIGVERRKRVRDESDVLDLPAHGACTMIRRRVLKAVGGYDERFGSQDGHEVWLRTLHRFRVGNVETPLFYYRQHAGSMSADREALLATRREIKAALASRGAGAVPLRSVAIVPVKNTYPGQVELALSPFAGRPLLDYTLDCAAAVGEFALIYVSTDDARVAAHCAGRPNVVAAVRDPRLSDPDVQLDEVVRAAVQDLELRIGVHPDVLAILNVHAPLRRPVHVREALDTLQVYDVDQVVSTYEDRELHFRHGRQGLEPINFAARRSLRLEREALYAGNNAVHVLWRDALRNEKLYEGRIGHVVMSREESLLAKSGDERRLAEAVMLARSPAPTSVGTLA